MPKGQSWAVCHVLVLGPAGFKTCQRQVFQSQSVTDPRATRQRLQLFCLGSGMIPQAVPNVQRVAIVMSACMAPARANTALRMASHFSKTREGTCKLVYRLSHRSVLRRPRVHAPAVVKNADVKHADLCGGRRNNSIMYDLIIIYETRAPRFFGASISVPAPFPILLKTSSLMFLRATTVYGHGPRVHS